MTSINKTVLVITAIIALIAYTIYIGMLSKLIMIMFFALLFMMIFATIFCIISMRKEETINLFGGDKQ